LLTDADEIVAKVQAPRVEVEEPTAAEVEAAEAEAAEGEEGAEGAPAAEGGSEDGSES
jgi:hypothetical protein